MITRNDIYEYYKNVHNIVLKHIYIGDIFDETDTYYVLLYDNEYVLFSTVAKYEYNDAKYNSTFKQIKRYKNCKELLE